MEKRLLIELFPRIARTAEECCEPNAEPGDSCCGSDDEGADPTGLNSLKERLKRQLPNASVHLYNYSLPMDRLMARKKLGEHLKKRGFRHIGKRPDDSILSLVPPAIAVNGELISFGAEVDQTDIDVLLRKWIQTE